MPEPQNFRSNGTLGRSEHSPPLPPRDYNQRPLPIRALIDRPFRLQNQTRESLSYRNLFRTERSISPPRDPTNVTLYEVKDLIEETLLRIEQIQRLFRIIQAQHEIRNTRRSPQGSNASH